MKAGQLRSLLKDKMPGTRAGKYGKYLAMWINFTIDSMPLDYRTRFLSELRTYSFEPRKNGEAVNSGCVHELDDLADADITNPEHLAKIVKEGIHLMYQKQTARKVMGSLLEKLKT